MKNLKSLLVALPFLITFIANAQDTYEWDEFGVGFEVASDFEVITNSSEEWELMSSDEAIFISVMPWSDPNVTLDDLEEATYWVAMDFVFGEDAEVDGDCGEVDDFDVCYVIGAVYDMDWDYYLVALMMDVGSDTNIQVAIAFNEGDEDEVVDMMNSFYAYD